ncbi:MAG TPA: hypothetical protein VKZ63_15525, partial [Kofleriaceae bacterium]|nr:hypothetical protein [Kofleriaceae bacterium]
MWIAAALLVAGAAGCGGARARDGAGGESRADWAVRLGGGGEVTARGIAPLPGGGAVLVGGFGGALEGGGAPLESAGGLDGIAVATGAGGEVTWRIALAGPLGEELSAVAVAPDGAIAVGGLGGPGARLGEVALEGPGEPVALVARLGDGGRPAWVRSIAASGYAVTTALAWTPDGDVIAAGYFAGALEAGGAALHATGSLDLWVARLAGQSGQVSWIHRGGGPGADAAFALAVAPGGAVAVGGSVSAWADLSSTRLETGDDAGDPFVAGVDAGGFTWARSLPGDGGAVARSLAALPGGELAVAIEFDGDLIAGDDRSLSAAGPSDLLIARVGRTGPLGWAVQVAGPEADTCAGLAVDGDRLIVAGAFGDEVRLGDLRLDGRGGRDGFVAALDLA